MRSARLWLGLAVTLCATAVGVYGAHRVDAQQSDPVVEPVVAFSNNTRTSIVLIEITKGHRRPPAESRFIVSNSPQDYVVPLEAGLRFYALRVNAGQRVTLSTPSGSAEAIKFRVVNVASEGN